MDLQAQVEKEGVQELHYTISQLESKVEQYSQRNRELQQSLIKLEAGASVPQTLQVNTQLMQSSSSFMQGRKQVYLLVWFVCFSQLVPFLFLNFLKDYYNLDLL